MSYLKMALKALQATTGVDEAGTQRSGFTSQAPNHTPTTEVSQVQPSTSPAPQEHVLTCADCHHFEANQGPNPLQGWGKCLKRNRGRYGCATACEAALAPGPKNASNAHLEN
jgi:hypothetical protein